MANNASDIAVNSISLDSVEETKVPSKGNGTLLPGSACGIIAATGVIQAVDAGALEEFVGLLEKHYSKDIDTAPATTDAVDLIIPKQSKKYIARIDSANTAAGNIGKPLEFSATSNGELMDAATLDDKSVARLAQVYNGTDDFAKVYWGMV